MAEATAAEEMQLKDAFKSYTRSTHILLSIRNVLLAARLHTQHNRGRPMSTSTIEAATKGRVHGQAAHQRLKQEAADAAGRLSKGGYGGMARYTSMGIDL